MFELGKIKVKLENGQFIVYRPKGFIQQELRRYPKLPDTRCEICGYPILPCNRHGEFLDPLKNLFLSKLIISGYYQKKPFDRLTEDVIYFRNLPANQKTHQISQILKELAKFVLIASHIPIHQLTYVLSPKNSNNCLPELSKLLAIELGLEFIHPKDFIEYNDQLHEKKRISHTKSFKSRKTLVTDIFKRKNRKITPKITNILIVDDIVHSGITISHFAKILKLLGAKKVYGFSWLRAIEGQKILDI